MYKLKQSRGQYWFYWKSADWIFSQRIHQIWSDPAVSKNSFSRIKRYMEAMQIGKYDIFQMRFYVAELKITCRKMGWLFAWNFSRDKIMYVGPCDEIGF